MSGLANDREAATNVPEPELHVVTSRLLTLCRALANAEVVESAGAAVVGGRTVISGDDDKDESYLLVVPGVGNRRAGRV